MRTANGRPTRRRSSEPELSVIVPVWAADPEAAPLLSSLVEAVDSLASSSEIVVAAGSGSPGIRELVEALGARFVQASGAGYGDILRAGLRDAAGRYVATLDADPRLWARSVHTLWVNRDAGEVVLASRYVPGATTDMTTTRRALSRLVNLIYRKALSVPYRDLSNGFRLFHRAVLEDIGPPEARGLDILPEMVVKSVCQGWKVVEIPFRYEGTSAWSRTRMVKVGSSFVRSLGKLFALRNSVRSADYDDRAFDSWIPLQRYWQRRRFRIVREFLEDAGTVLDVGCGSSRIVQTLPRVVGTDLAMRKLRWLRGRQRALLQADMNLLPFRDGAFDAVVTSEVIEHIPREQVRLEELVRVTRPGGMVVVGTPDYGRLRWRVLEWIYGKVFRGGYASEHINRYTYRELRAQLEALGLEIMDCKYVGGSEMVFKTRLPSRRRLELAAM